MYLLPLFPTAAFVSGCCLSSFFFHASPPAPSFAPSYPTYAWEQPRRTQRSRSLEGGRRIAAGVETPGGLRPTHPPTHPPTHHLCMMNEYGKPPLTHPHHPPTHRHNNHNTTNPSETMQKPTGENGDEVKPKPTHPPTHLPTQTHPPTHLPPYRAGRKTWSSRNPTTGCKQRT